MASRSARFARFPVFVAFSLTLITPAFAAGSYTQDFSAPPSSWVVFDDSASVTESFVASGGYYTNTMGGGASAPFRSVAYYNGTTWDTNYTYTVKLNSDYESSGNRVGVVFNLQDSGNYYEMSVQMRTYDTSTPRQIVAQGGAALFKVTAGTHTPIATFDATGVPWPENDTFFPVEVVRIGTTTRISVNGVLAFNTTALTGYGAGRVGFFAQYNTGRFDDVQVVDAVPLFKSGFETGVTNTGPTCIGPSGTATQFEDLSGKDITGYHWKDDLSFWGAAQSQVFNTAVSCSLNYVDYVDIRVEAATGPTGASSLVLKNTVNKWHNPTLAEEPRAGALYVFNGTPASAYYIRRYLKYPSNLLTAMGNGSWFVQHEYKTGCSVALPGRFMILWRQNIPDGVNKVPFYEAARDLNNNCSNITGPVWSPPVQCMPSSGNCPAMPLGQWFYDEMYVSYPTSGTGGVVKYAVNGQPVFDIAVAAADALPSLPNRVKLTPGYMNTNGMEIQVDDLEMWSAPPCAQFPCGAPAHVN
jgi:hypothetical protein